MKLQKRNKKTRILLLRILLLSLYILIIGCTIKHGKENFNSKKKNFIPLKKIKNVKFSQITGLWKCETGLCDYFSHYSFSGRHKQIGIKLPGSTNCIVFNKVSCKNTECVFFSKIDDTYGTIVKVKLKHSTKIRIKNTYLYGSTKGNSSDYTIFSFVDSIDRGCEDMSSIEYPE